VTVGDEPPPFSRIRSTMETRKLGTPNLQVWSPPAPYRSEEDRFTLEARR